MIVAQLFLNEREALRSEFGVACAGASEASVRGYQLIRKQHELRLVSRVLHLYFIVETTLQNKVSIDIIAVCGRKTKRKRKVGKIVLNWSCKVLKSAAWRIVFLELPFSFDTNLLVLSALCCLSEVLAG